MRREISAGIIVYRKSREGPKFLILYHGHDYWNFAKGKIESEERSMAAAFRETREETGFTAKELRLAENFKVYERFTFRRSGQPVFKTVIFYLAETDIETVKLSSEHQGYGWFLYREAKKILGKYRDSQRVLRQAYGFLRHKRQEALHHAAANKNSPAAKPSGQ
ncbi:MAG: NUDIX domain-containing protein [Candidatus Liptonbacteria bacterium]|nr:NUDIX domain-containing protein [Candidatus Liptonbacteria bacterium]